MIGLVDYDLQITQSQNLTPPNIEIMKLATYYKLEENMFCRLVSLDEQDLTPYSKIFFFSETTREPLIPKQFLQSNNVVYGGTTFTKGKYIPFENSIIDYTIPKTYIYKEYLKQKYNEGIKANIISHILDNSYYRFFAGDELLPIPPIKSKKRIFIYDREFFFNGGEKTIQKIAENRPSSIFFIHPIICKTITQYCKFREIPRIARTNKIILDLNIPLEDLNYLFKKYLSFFLQDIVKTSQVYLPLGGDFYSGLQYYKDYIYKMNLLYSFWSKNIPIKIFYTYPNIGFKDPLQDLSLLTQAWAGNHDNKKSMKNRIYLLTKNKISKYYPIWERLLQFFPSAADLIDQTYNDLSQKGVWRI